MTLSLHADAWMQLGHLLHRCAPSPIVHSVQSLEVSCGLVTLAYASRMQTFDAQQQVITSARVAFLPLDCQHGCASVGDAVRGSVSLRIQQLDVACETKTRDNVFVNIVVSVQYQVLQDKIVDAFYKLTSQTDQVRMRR